MLIPQQYQLNMQNQNQSISISIGQNLTPSSIISHPKEKKFYVTANSMSKKSDINLVSIIQYDQSNEQPQLKNSIFKYQQQLQKIVVTQENKYFVLGKDSKTSKIFSIVDDGVDNTQKIIYETQNKIENLLYTKNREMILSSPKNIVKYDSEFKAICEIQGNINISALDPHHQNLLLYASNVDKKINVWDMQTKNPKYKIDNVHNGDILSIDMNPNKQYYFFSVHSDCLKFWDMRRSNIPVKCCQDHHSLILDAKFNSNYDELVLISYDDGTVGLFRMTSISSASSALALSNRDQDGLVKLYDQHEDSAVGVAWAGSSPWLFSSVSYNSNLIVNTVPSSEKHRILF